MIRAYYLSVACSGCRDVISLCNNENLARIEQNAAEGIWVTCPKCGHKCTYTRKSIKFRKFARIGKKWRADKEVHKAA